MEFDASSNASDGDGGWPAVTGSASELVMDDGGERIRHVFVLTLWVESMATVRGGATWRGRIGNALTGEETGVASLRDIAAFVARYLESADDQSMMSASTRRRFGRRRSRPDGWR